MHLRRPSPLSLCAISYGLLYVGIIVHFYPAKVDRPEVVHFQPTAEQQVFYNAAFDTQQARYRQVARTAAGEFRIKDRVQDFVAQNGLQNARVLEVGSGEGSLQDLVADYTGLDISASVRGNYHKRFVQADARAIPFADHEFDAVWSIWVLEHVPNPEQVLREIRRVLKPNGLLYLLPAWMCSELAAEGYLVRPYSDFGPRGKLTKATAPIRNSPLFQAAHILPVRAGRLAAWKLHGKPTNLHYRPLKPNYREYWIADSDAVNSIDMFEAYLWFTSRGDQCLNCPPAREMLRQYDTPLVIRVNPQSVLVRSRTQRY